MGALRPQTPDQRSSTSGHQPATKLCLEEQTTSACRAGVYESLKLLAHRKPGKSHGENELSPWEYSRLSPDAQHPGWRLSAAGPEAQSHQAGLPHSSDSGNQAVTTRQVPSAGEGPGRSSPWRRSGRAERPASPRQIPICNSCVSRGAFPRHLPE